MGESRPLSVEVPKKMKGALKKQATEEFTSVASLVRRALAREIGRDKLEAKQA